MKRIFSLLFVIILFKHCFSQTWTQLNSPVSSPYGLSCVSFLDCLYGAAGGGGSNGSTDVPIAAFTPDGTHWSNSVVPYMPYTEMAAIQYVNPTTVYAIAGNFSTEGYFCRSIDGGQTFTDTLFPVLGSPGSYSFFGPSSMVFFDSLNGYVGGDYYYNGGSSWEVLKTADGGKTWQQHVYRDKDAISSICFPDIFHGFALSEFDSLYKTVDSGHTWATVHAFNTGVTPNSIYFQNANTGWAPCGGGHLLTTTDGGTSWTPVNTYTNYDFTKIIFTDTSNVWLLSASTIVHNKNGATNFLTQTDTFNFRSTLTDLYMLNNSLGYAVGSDGSIYRYSGPLDTTLVTRAICASQSFTIGGQSFSTEGTYTLSLIGSGGCDSVVVSLHLTVDSLSQPTVTDNGGVLSTGSFTTYQWLYNGTAVTGATGQTCTPTFAGNYSVAVTNASGCSDTSAAFMVTGIANLSAESFSVSPNPANDFVEVALPGLDGHLIFRDMTGQVISAYEIRSEQRQALDLRNLPSGIYLLTFEGVAGTVTKRIVKE